VSAYDALMQEVAGLPVELRALGLTAAITKALSDVGAEAPVLVGGAAAEFWTAGRCTTSDVDLVLNASNTRVRNAMSLLGFKNEGGRHWHHAAYDLYVEFPSNTLDYPFKSQALPYSDDLRIYIVTPESIVADRLASFSVNGYRYDGARAILIAHARGSAFDWDEVSKMAQACLVKPDLVDRVRQYVEAHREVPFPDHGQMDDDIFALYDPVASAKLEAEDDDDDDA
jgi:hypothetical protein